MGSSSHAINRRNELASVILRANEVSICTYPLRSVSNIFIAISYKILVFCNYMILKFDNMPPNVYNIVLHSDQFY